jgi:peptidoglycan hydrolase CwlO-like protein
VSAAVAGEKIMELRDVLTIIGILLAAGTAYVAAMTKMTLKVQHLEDSKIDREEIYTVVQGNQKEIMEKMRKVELDVGEIKTKVNGLQCNRTDWKPGSC